MAFGGICVDLFCKFNMQILSSVMKQLSFAVLLSGILMSGFAQDAPWDTTQVDSKTFFAFDAVAAGLELEADSALDKVYNRTVWDSIMRMECTDRVAMYPVMEGFTCGVSSVSYNGHSYGTVEIGDQCFFSENLLTTKFNDGADIAEVTDGTSWIGLSSAAYCKYDNDAANTADYGLLYNWFVVESDKICPSGWHVPTETEWATFTATVGGATEAGADAIKVTSTNSPSWDGNNSTGFSVVPAGQRQGTDGTFKFQGSRAAFWSTTASSGGSYQIRRVAETLENTDNDAKFGLGIRCLLDSE